MSDPEWVPQKLTPTHQLVAFHIAAGRSQVDAARLVGYHPMQVSRLCAAPLFQALVRDIQRDMRERTVEGVVETIIHEGPKSVATIARLRDTAESEQVQLGAARDLLDRNPLTARIAKSEQDTTVRVTVDGPAMTRLLQVLEEDEGRTILPAIATPLGTPVRRLEDVLAEREDEA